MNDIWFKRYYEEGFEQLLSPGKVWTLYGPRRAGKTALITKMLESYKGNVYFQTGEHMPLREVLASENVNRIIAAFKEYDLVVIDEAQKIPEIGRGLKMIVDQIPGIKVIASGSSSFELSNRIGEPLTGRQRVATLYPVSALELSSQFGGMRLMDALEQYLIYGGYPEILGNESEKAKREYLITLRDSYLLKDILELENIRNASKLADLLKQIAFQIGKEVSINELSNALGIGKGTVERYLDLLEKTFIIRKVRGFSRNLRKEITKTARYYFIDNGIRNALINNFNPLNSRDDVGMLWENYLYVERLKKRTYQQIYANEYFWRTYDKKELDLVEERDGRLFGYEIAWTKKKRPPALWTETYPNAEYQSITRETFLEFIT